MPLDFEQLVEGNIYWGHVPNNINFLGTLSVNPTPNSSPLPTRSNTSPTPPNSDRHLFLLLEKVRSKPGVVTIAILSSFGGTPLESIRTRLNIQDIKRVLLPCSTSTPNHRMDGQPPLTINPPFTPPAAQSYLILQSSLMKVSNQRKIREKTAPKSTAVSGAELNRVIDLIHALGRDNGGGGDGPELDDHDELDIGLVNMRYVEPFEMEVYPLV